MGAFVSSNMAWFATLGIGAALCFSVSCSNESGNSVDTVGDFSLPEFRLADLRVANERCAAFFIEGDIRIVAEQSLDRFAPTIDAAFMQPNIDGNYVSDLPDGRRVSVSLEYGVMAVFRFFWKDQVYEQRKAIAAIDQESSELEPSFFVSVTSTAEFDVADCDWGKTCAYPKEIASIHRYRLLSDSSDGYNESVAYHCKSPMGSYFWLVAFVSG